MNITIHKSKLIEPLTQASKAVNSKSAFPAMTGILFVASKSGLKIVGSDVEITVVRMIPETDVTVTRLGSIVLPSKELVNIIENVPSDLIEINVKGLVAHIAVGNVSIELAGIDADEFTYKPIKTSDGMIIPAAKLNDMIKRTIFSVADADRARQFPTLAGIRIKVGSGEFSITATDKITVSKVKTTIESEIDYEAIIATAHAKMIPALFKNGEVEFQFSDAYAVFKSENLQIYMRLIEGEFPAIDDALLQAGESQIVLPKQDITTAINLAKSVVEKSRILIIANSDIRFIGRGKMGKTDESISSIRFEGEPFKFAISADNILAALGSLDGDEVTIKVVKAYAIITNGTNDAIYLSMTMRAHEEEFK